MRMTSNQEYLSILFCSSEGTFEKRVIALVKIIEPYRNCFIGPSGGLALLLLSITHIF